MNGRVDIEINKYCLVSYWSRLAAFLVVFADCISTVVLVVAAAAALVG